MKLVCCVAKNFGMLFCGKRVSRDSAVIEKILSLTGGEKIHMTSSSATLFPDSDRIVVTSDFSEAGENFCFVEDPGFITKDASEIFLFHWNRDYPADALFPLDLKAQGYKKTKKEDFEGTSHKKITLEHYER